MFRPRVIPVLLLKNNGLVKSINFKNHRYIGDPINAVKLFNDLMADELILLDIDATKENRIISSDLIKEISEEANMPFAIGGGIKKIDDIEKLLKLGADKVIINSEAYKNEYFIKEASDYFGSSTIIVSIDINKNFFGYRKVYIESGKTNTKIDPLTYSIKMENLGAGELFLNSIYNDGKMLGFDLELINKISNSLSIPIIACGGAGNLNDLVLAYDNMASAVSAGSLFVYQGSRKAVLINYPSQIELENIFLNK